MEPKKFREARRGAYEARYFTQKSWLVHRVDGQQHLRAASSSMNVAITGRSLRLQRPSAMARSEFLLCTGKGVTLGARVGSLEASLRLSSPFAAAMQSSTAWGREVA